MAGGQRVLPLQVEGLQAHMGFNSRGHSSEIPFHGTSRQRISQTNCKLTSVSASVSGPTSTESQSSDPGSECGDSSLPTEAGDSEVEASAPPCMHLKPCSFKIGTWNMNGLSGQSGNMTTHKLPLAEDILLVEHLDLLLLTETHSTGPTLPVSNQVKLLASSAVHPTLPGQCPRAGLTLLAINDGSWSCPEFLDIIPGYAFLAHLSHSRSTESFWFLGVYGDNSGGLVSLAHMYQSVADWLLDHIGSLPPDSWHGCITAGDWNFVTHPANRSPDRLLLPGEVRLSGIFDTVTDACLLDNPCKSDIYIASPHTYFSSTASGPISSCLDRIYLPKSTWSLDRLITNPTQWSDHHLVVATCFKLDPRVQMACPAPPD